MIELLLLLWDSALWALIRVHLGPHTFRLMSGSMLLASSAGSG